MSSLNRMRFPGTFALLSSAFCAVVLAQEAPEHQVPKPSPREASLQALSQGWGDYVTASVQLSSNQLGIEVANAEKTLCSQLGIQGGLVITKSPEGSEGAKAGLQVHDVILNVNNPRSEPVVTVEGLNTILTNSAGQKIEIGLLRGGKMQLVGVTVPQRHDLAVALDQGFATNQPERYRIGIHLAEADETLRAQLQLSVGQGLVVTEVIENTPAAKAGFQAHDVILELDGKPLGKVEEINQQVQEIKSRAVTAKVLRSGKSKAIEVTPEKAAEEKATAIVETTPQFLVHQNELSRFVWGTRLQQGPDANFILMPSTAFVFTGAGAADGSQPTDPRTQVNALKQQLAEMQKVIASLEATLSAAQPKPTEEKK